MDPNTAIDGDAAHPAGPSGSVEIALDGDFLGASVASHRAIVLPPLSRALSYCDEKVPTMKSSPNFARCATA
jgi:hypothetical protein